MRGPDDHIGHAIDAVGPLCDALEETTSRLLEQGHLKPEDGREMEVAHLLVLHVIDRLADRGLVDRDLPQIDRISYAMAELGALAAHRGELRGEGS